VKGLIGTLVFAVAAFTSAVGLASASSPGRPQARPPAGQVVARIPIPGNSGVLAVGEGAVWASSDAVPTLTRIDPTSAAVTRTKIEQRNPCSELPGSCGEAAAGNGALWIARLHDNSVLRIDPKNGSIVATIPVGLQPEGIATTPGAVWVVNKGDLTKADPSVSRIDPATNQVVATVPIGPRRFCCADHMSLTAGAGAVWASLPGQHSVVRIDPATNAVAARIHMTGPPCAFLVADARAVWAAGSDCTGSVMRIDPRTNRPSGTVRGAETPIGLVLGFGSLWVADLDAKTIDRVNARTGRIVARLRVGGYPVRLAIGFGSVWVRDDTGRVLRIRPR
jgi:virginiamycin B lyase